MNHLSQINLKYGRRRSLQALADAMERETEPRSPFRSSGSCPPSGCRGDRDGALRPTSIAFSSACRDSAARREAYPLQEYQVPTASFSSTMPRTPWIRPS